MEMNEPCSETYRQRRDRQRLAALAREYPKEQEGKTWGMIGTRDQIYELLAWQFGLSWKQVRGYFES